MVLVLLLLCQRSPHFTQLDSNVFSYVLLLKIGALLQVRRDFSSVKLVEEKEHVHFLGGAWNFCGVLVDGLFDGHSFENLFDADGILIDRHEIALQNAH